MPLSTSYLKNPNDAPPSVARTVTATTDTVTTADKGKIVAVDTTSNAVTLTLPSTGLTVGDAYSFLDAKANWGAVPATLAIATFFGTVQTISLDVTGTVVTATWRGLPIGWTVGEGSAKFDNTTLSTLFSSRAPLASPALTGVPTAPTAAVGTNTEQVATTAFVQAAVEANNGMNGTIGSIGYTSGKITSWVANGVTYTATYGIYGISTISNGTITKTITYDVNGVATGIS